MPQCKYFSTFHSKDILHSCDQFSEPAERTRSNRSLDGVEHIAKQGFRPSRRGLRRNAAEYASDCLEELFDYLALVWLIFKTHRHAVVEALSNVKEAWKLKYHWRTARNIHASAATAAVYKRRGYTPDGVHSRLKESAEKIAAHFRACFDRASRAVAQRGDRINQLPHSEAAE